MAVTGTVVRTWQNTTRAYAAVRVSEGGAAGDVEYVAAVALADDQGQAKSAAQLKTELVAAVKAQRDGQTATTTALAGFPATVSL